MVLCPDVVPFVDHRFDCRDLLQRSVIHYGTAKAVLRAWVNHYGAMGAALAAQSRAAVVVVYSADMLDSN